MARTVTDAVAVFQVIVGEDPDDPVTARSRGRALAENYAASLAARRPQGRAHRRAPAGVRARAPTDPEIVAVFMTRASTISKRPAPTIVDPAAVEGLDAIRGRRVPARAWGSSTTSTPTWRRTANSVPVHSLDEIVKSRPVPSRRSQRRLKQAQQGPGNGPDATRARLSGVSRARSAPR